jgi:hypothetical protein
MAASVLRTRQTAHNSAHNTVQYIYKRFTFSEIDQTNSSRFSVALKIDALPAGCVPLETHVRVVTAFSSGDLIIGTSDSGSSAGVVSTQDVVSGTTGHYVVDRYYGTYSTVDKPLYVYTATSGTGAGVADIWQAFVLGPTPGNA